MYSDTDLLNQIKRRDSVALERLYDRYEKTLFLLFRRTQVDEALIHSAMTELFRTVWEQPTRHVTRTSKDSFCIHYDNSVVKENIFRLN